MMIAQPKPDRDIDDEVTEFSDDEIWHKNMELICPINFDGVNQANEMVEFTRISTTSGEKFIYVGSFNDGPDTYIRVDDLTNPRFPTRVARKLYIENDEGNVELGPLITWTSDSNNVYAVCTIRNNNKVGELTADPLAKAIIINLTELMEWGEEEAKIIKLDERKVETLDPIPTFNSNIYIGYIESIRDYFLQARCDTNHTESYKKIHTLTVDKKSSALTFSHLCNSAYTESSIDKTDAFVDLFMLEGVSGYSDYGIETHTNYNTTNLISLSRLTKDGKPIRVTRDNEQNENSGEPNYMDFPDNWPTSSAVHETHAHGIKIFDIYGNPTMETLDNNISLNVACTSSSKPGSECNKDSLELYDMEGGYGIIDVDYSDPDDCIVTFKQWIDGDPDRKNPNVRTSPETFSGSDGWSANVGHTIEPVHVDLKNHFFVTISELAAPAFAELTNGDAWLEPYNLLTSDVNGAYAGLGTIPLNDDDGVFDDRRLSNNIKIWGGDRGHHLIRGIGSENQSNPELSTWNEETSGPISAYDVIEQSVSDRNSGTSFPVQYIDDIEEIDCGPFNTSRAPNTMHHIRTYFGTTGVLPDKDEDFRLRTELFVGAYVGGSRVIDIKNFIRTDDISNDITLAKDTIFEAAYFDYFPTLSYDKDSRYFYSRTTLSDYTDTKEASDPNDDIDYEFKYQPSDIGIQNYYSSIFDSYPDSRREGLEDDEDFVYAWGGHGAKQSMFLQYGGYLVLRYFRDELGGTIRGNIPSNPIKYQDRVFQKVNLQGDFKVQRDVTIAEGAEVWLLPGEEGSGKTHDNMELLAGDNGPTKVLVDGTLHVSLAEGNNGGSEININVPIEINDEGIVYIHKIRDGKDRLAHIDNKITVHDGGQLILTQDAKVFIDEILVEDGGSLVVNEGVELSLGKERHFNYGITEFNGESDNKITVTASYSGEDNEEKVEKIMDMNFSDMDYYVQLVSIGGSSLGNLSDEVSIKHTIFKGVHVFCQNKNITTMKNNEFYDNTDEDYTKYYGDDSRLFKDAQFDAFITPDVAETKPDFATLTIEDNKFEDLAIPQIDTNTKFVRGVSVSGPFNLLIKSNDFDNHKIGAKAHLTTTALIEDNTFDNMQNGLKVSNASSTVCYNTFNTNNVGTVFNLSDVSSVYNNTLINVGNGMKGIDGSNQNYRGNTFTNYLAGVYVENSIALLRGVYEQSLPACDSRAAFTYLGRNIFSNAGSPIANNSYTIGIQLLDERSDIYLKHKHADVYMECGYNDMSELTPEHIYYEKESPSDANKTVDVSQNDWDNPGGIHAPRTNGVTVTGAPLDVSEIATPSCSIGYDCSCKSTITTVTVCLDPYPFGLENVGNWAGISSSDSADTFFDEIYEFYYDHIEDVSLTPPCRKNFGLNLMSSAVYGDSTSVKIELINSKLSGIYMDTNYTNYERVNLGYTLAEGFERVGELDSAIIVLQNIHPLDPQTYYSRADWDIDRLKSMQFTDYDSISTYHNSYLQKYIDRIRVRTDSTSTTFKRVVDSDVETEFDQNRLFENEPNPFNSTTKIDYYLVQDDVIKITILDETGKVVMTAFEGSMNKGRHNLNINMENMSTGVYFYILESSSGKLMEKMYLIK